LRPSLKHAPVSRYVKNDVYSNLINFGKKLGFKAVIAGPFVRSSYMAKECYYLYKNNKAN
jgi:lipoic acid synthetase